MRREFKMGDRLRVRRRTPSPRGRRPVWGSSAPCATHTFRNSCSSRLHRKTDRMGEECSKNHIAPLVIGRALRTGMKPMAGERNVGASQPSARRCSATDPVVRAAVYIACGLWSLTSQALAQVPAPTAEFQSKPIQPWQGGKAVEFRQPRPVAFDKAIPGISALAKPGTEGVGQEAPWNVEEQVLLPLLLEEKSLLVDYGPEHPDVYSIRERIRIVREYLAQHPPAPPPTVLRPLPPISLQTPYREAPSTRASTSSSSGHTSPLPLPPVRSQILEPGGTEDGTEVKDRYGNTQTLSSRSRPEPVRPAGFSTAGNPILDAGTTSASLAAPPPTVRSRNELVRPADLSTAGNPPLNPGTTPASPAGPLPTVVKTNDKDTHPAALATTNSSAQAVVSPPSRVSDNSESQPSQEQPRGNAFFETGFGQLIGIVGAVLIGVLIHLIALVLILRRYGTHLARVFRVELVNPPVVGFVGQMSAGAETQSVAASPASKEVTQSSTAEAFDIGPTYAEEMQQKQEALRQQEEAVLRHIFELNMQMREELGQLSGDAA